MGRDPAIVFMTPVHTLDVIKVLLPATAAFLIGIAITPFITHYLYKYKLWKKTPGKTSGLGGGGTPIFNSLHRTRDSGIPRMGGVIIWASVFVTTGFFWALNLLFNSTALKEVDFLSVNQTWVPLGTLFMGALIGLIDDFTQVFRAPPRAAGGLLLRHRIALVLLIGAVVGSWFFFKLEHSSVYMPFIGDLALGPFFIPFFMLVMLSLFSGGVIDGIDGLAGGIMGSIFAAYAGIAFFQEQFDIAALAAVFVGATLAFLWFNIPPARFYMGESGMIALTATLAVIAFLTGAVLPIVIIAFPLYLAAGSVIVQVLSKKFRAGKKVFLVAPIHHHFEAIGWPPQKVAMRFWVVSVICAIIGMIIALVG